MKIETTRQVEETTIVVNNLLDIELKTIEDILYVRLIPHQEVATFFLVHDFKGVSRVMAVERANQVILDQITNSENVIVNDEDPI